MNKDYKLIKENLLNNDIFFDDDLDLDWEDASDYNADFAKEIFDVINNILEKNDLYESFLNKNKLKQHFEKHCLARQDKKSRRSKVFYDFQNIEDYKKYEQIILNKLNSDNLLILNSLGNCAEVYRVFRKFFEGDKSLLLGPNCGFSTSNNKARSILLYSFSTDITTNYPLNTITLDAFSGNITYTLYPIDANYLEKKLNNIIIKYCGNKEKIIKINNPSEKNLKEARQQTALKSNGVYSVMNNSWIKEPVAEDIPEINQDDFEKLFNKWEDSYFKIKENPTKESIENFIEDIYDLRKTSIANDGEYGLGNLVFKECRNLGYLDSLKDIKKEIVNKELSL